MKPQWSRNSPIALARQNSTVTNLKFRSATASDSSPNSQLISFTVYNKCNACCSSLNTTTKLPETGSIAEYPWACGCISISNWVICLSNVSAPVAIYNCAMLFVFCAQMHLHRTAHKTIMKIFCQKKTILSFSVFARELLFYLISKPSEGSTRQNDKLSFFLKGGWEWKSLCNDDERNTKT